MAKIRVLEKHIAELIAAGEVVERPAAVVKELLENAIDAGATQITLSIESGGIRLIEISDNGTGIETEFIETAFIRHATSKIQNEDDLNSIATLGFRGEALASIASVSRVEVLTKTQDDEFACSYRIEGGVTQGLEVSARAVGTTIRVADLFYNTPARMKFLKKDASEGTFVADMLGHVALSHPEISFKFVREGKLQYVTPGDGDLQSAAYAVLGREFARDLVKIEDTSGLYTVSGYVSPPRNCRASRSMQYFYINGRYVKNRTMIAAIETAYRGTVMHGKFPGCVLNMQMPHDMVDVNVHPAKTEVRFAREKDVFDAVYRAVKSEIAPSDAEARRNAMAKMHMPVETIASQAYTQGGLSTLQGEAVASEMMQSASMQGTNLQHTNANAQSATGVAFGDDTAASATPRATTVSADAPITPQVQMHSVGVGTSAPAKGLEAQYQTMMRARAQATQSFAPTRVSERVLDDILENEDAPAVVAPFTSANPLANTNPFAGDMFFMQEETQSASAGKSDNASITDDVITEDAKYATYEAQADEAQQTTFYAGEELSPLRYMGEAFKTYVFAQKDDTICVIDKHAAHERIIYERLLDDYGTVASQMLLEAVVVNLSAAEKQALLENTELLDQAGIELDDFGGTSVLVRAVPADVVVQNVEDLVVEVAAKLAAGSVDAMNEKTEWVLHSIACRAAMKAGDTTNTTQLIGLAQQILSGEIPPYCPHGRPCIITITRKELEKRFGRII